MRISAASIYCSLLCLATAINAVPVRNGPSRDVKVEGQKHVRSVKRSETSVYKRQSDGSETDKLRDFLKDLGGDDDDDDNDDDEKKDDDEDEDEDDDDDDRSSTGKPSSATTATTTFVTTSASPSTTGESSSTSSIPAPPTGNRDPASLPRMVFAHFMVGIVASYGPSNWERDMNMAKSYGIDGFALNVGKDSYTESQLRMAYDAAARVGFEVFVSFDFNWFSTSDTAAVIDIMKPLIGLPAQHRVAGSNAAFVSTFAGDGFDWSAVRSAFPSTPLYIVPNWQPSAGNAGNGGVDGLFSWYAWPSANNAPIDSTMSTDKDQEYLGQLSSQGKAYMAPVSPWFFTHFGKEVSYSKNWLFKSETLWYERWEQILDLAARSPNLRYLEIITWNDYGESHYVGPSDNGHSDDGSGAWTNGLSHDALLEFARPYITAFKTGSRRPVVDRDMLVYWYRPHLKSVSSCDGTDICGARPAGWDIVGDSVFVASFSTGGGSVSVKSGDKEQVTKSIGPGVNMMQFDMGVGEQVFSMSSGSRQVSGSGSSPVANSCWKGNYNFNFFSGLVS